MFCSIDYVVQLWAVSVIKRSSVRLSVCPVDRQQQRRPAGLLLRSGAGSRYTPWVKKQDTTLAHNFPNINRFSKFFRCRLSGKFATNSRLNIPPHLKYVATLPCEIWMSENWRQSEYVGLLGLKIVNHKVVQLSIQAGMAYFDQYKFITQFAGERFLKFVNTWQSYRQNGWSCHAPIRLRLLSSKMQNSPNK